MINDPVSTPSELDRLLHPANAFAHPRDVVADPDLTLNEKRAILASWASDACAVEDALAWRALPGAEPVRWDDIMDALRLLDEAPPPQGWMRPRWRRRVRGKGDDHGGDHGDDHGHTAA